MKGNNYLNGISQLYELSLCILGLVPVSAEITVPTGKVLRIDAQRNKRCCKAGFGPL